MEFQARRFCLTWKTRMPPRPLQRGALFQVNFGLNLNEHHGSAGVPQSGLHGVVALPVSGRSRHLEHGGALQCTLGGGRAPAPFINGPGRGKMAAAKPQLCLGAFLLRPYRPEKLENRWRSVPPTDTRISTVNSAIDPFLASLAGLTYPRVLWKADSLRHRISRSGSLRERRG